MQKGKLEKFMSKKIFFHQVQDAERITWKFEVKKNIRVLFWIVKATINGLGSRDYEYTTLRNVFIYTGIGYSSSVR